jgi:hypothetical protein
VSPETSIGAQSLVLPVQAPTEETFYDAQSGEDEIDEHQEEEEHYAVEKSMFMGRMNRDLMNDFKEEEEEEEVLLTAESTFT